VGGTGNDIGFDVNAFTFGTCVINPAIGAGTANAQLAQITVSPGVERLGILGFNADALPNGLLYTCPVSIDASVGAGSYTLQNTPSASDPLGSDLPGVLGTAAQIVVSMCTGDCNGDGLVTIGEVIKCVNLFLGQPLCNPTSPTSSCPVADASNNGMVSIGEVIQCVNRFLSGCQSPTMRR